MLIERHFYRHIAHRLVKHNITILIFFCWRAWWATHWKHLPAIKIGWTKKHFQSWNACLSMKMNTVNECEDVQIKLASQFHSTKFYISHKICIMQHKEKIVNDLFSYDELVYFTFSGKISTRIVKFNMKKTVYRFCWKRRCVEPCWT